MATLDYVVSSLEIASVTAGRDLFPSRNMSLDLSFQLNGWSFSSKGLRRPSLSQRLPCWKKANWEGVNHTLSLLPWCILETNSVDMAVETFYDWIFAVVKDCIPHRVCRSKKYPMWLKNDTIPALRNKRKAFEKFEEIITVTVYQSPIKDLALFCCMV
ncbi:hypothetical protein J437_LFUL007196 [Ladona fulva]|uniref:Uncharacterized protein n=1 Tax=Ladona fulva TaxID=123851 RepID=A0A8K0NXA8_LADFU|nr:hypothetical protein J437_LFUL007196 [Ladona fulva]